MCNVTMWKNQFSNLYSSVDDDGSVTCFALSPSSTLAALMMVIKQSMNSIAK